MSKRQSLKALQERLSQRMSVANEVSSAAAAWLGVGMAEARYLIPLAQAGEIFSWVPAQRVPYTQPWYVGLVSLRGELYGVIDLQRLTCYPIGAQADTLDRATTDAQLVSLHAAFGIPSVLWVDRLLGLHHPSMFQAIAPRPDQAPAFYARRLIDRQGQTWQELDLQALVSDPAFLSIAI